MAYPNYNPYYVTVNVVQSQTAFENFFYTFVTYELTSRGIMSLALQQELDRGIITRLVARRLAGTSNVSKLAYFSELVTTPPRSFAQGIPEYDNWYRDTYLLRNEVIHRGKMMSHKNRGKTHSNPLRVLLPSLIRTGETSLSVNNDPTC